VKSKLSKSQVRKQAVFICQTAAMNPVAYHGEFYDRVVDTFGLSKPARHLAVAAWVAVVHGSSWTIEADGEAAALLATGWSPGVAIKRRRSE
jgi:hypothetical protein